MSHKFVQFKDFEYLTESKSTPANIKVIVYVKVVGDKDESLGSLRFGLYQDLIEVTLKECISDIVSQNYPKFKAYESEIIKI